MKKAKYCSFDQFRDDDILVIIIVLPGITNVDRCKSGLSRLTSLRNLLIFSPAL